MTDIKYNIAYYPEPAWNEIPNEPTLADMEDFVNHLQCELKEVQAALSLYGDGICPRYALELAMELQDVKVMANSTLELLRRMPYSEPDLPEIAARIVNLKNKGRGLHHRKGDTAWKKPMDMKT